jgi:hypothetical protein
MEMEKATHLDVVSAGVVDKSIVADQPDDKPHRDERLQLVKSKALLHAISCFVTVLRSCILGTNVALLGFARRFQPLLERVLDPRY